MLLGAYSHNGLTSLGKFYTMSIHQLEHALSAFDNKIAHGAGLSVLIPAWMEYCYSKDINKFVHFGEVVFKLNSDEKNISAKMSIQSLKNYFKKIGMPTSLTELGVKKEDIPLIADRLTVNDTRVVGLKSIQPLKKEDVIKIFNLAL